MVVGLENLGVDKISAWGVRDDEDKLDLVLAPNEGELDLIEDWLKVNNKKVSLHRENSQLKYKENKKLTLFPDGTLSNTWCK
jgi:hypothetical protein